MDADALRRELDGQTIFIVPYCHPDWAWTYTREWHEERYALVYRDVLEIMHRDPDFRWFMDTENEQLAPFRERHPELMDELRERVLEGRIGVSGGTICDPHPHRIGGESFVRNMTMGRRYFETRFPGVDLSVLVLNDVVFGHGQVPQLALKAGYRYYRAWRPGEALDQKGIPRHFHFRGLDGSTILSSRGIYGGTYHSFPEDFESDWEGAMGRLAGEIHDSILMSPGKVGWWSHGMDDGRPLMDMHEKPVDLLRFRELFNERENATLEFATPKDVFDALEAKADGIATLEGPLDPVGWSYWYGQIGNESLRTWRCYADEALVAAETWQTLDCVFGKSYPEGRMSRLWRLLLKTCPHATLWLFEDDYQELLADVKSVVRDANQLVASAIAKKAEHASSPGEGQRVVLFNDLGWDRSEVVFFHKAFPARGTADVSVLGPEGTPLRHQLLDIEPYEDGTLKEATVAVEACVPAVGYSAIAVTEVRGEASGSPPEVPADSFTVESPTVSLTFSGGRLASLEDGLSGTEYATPDALRFYRIADTGPYHYGPVQEVLDATDVTCRLMSDGELLAHIEVEGRLGEHGIQQELTLHKPSGLLDVTTVIDSAGGDGFFRTEFPLSYDGDLVADIPFGVEPRDVTREPYGTLERMRENVFWGFGWTAYGDGKRGCALLIGSGMQGFAFDPETRVLGHTLLKVITHPREGWERHETRVREGKGRQIFRYAFLPLSGDWRSARIAQASLNWRRQVRVVKPHGPAGDAPTSHSWLRIAPGTLVLSALHRDGDAHVLRFYETHGCETQATVTLPFEPLSVTETDLNGEPLERGLSLEGATVRTTVQPWEIVTLRVLP